MLGFCRKLNKNWGSALLLALGAAALVAIIAPTAQHVQRDGFITICSGSSIAYLPLPAVDGTAAEADGTSSPVQPQQDTLCTCLTQHPAILPLLIVLALLATRPNPPLWRELRQLPFRRDIKPFHSQGPPLPAA
jgi:hypothetical protein